MTSTLAVITVSAEAGSLIRWAARFAKARGGPGSGEPKKSSDVGNGKRKPTASGRIEKEQREAPTIAADGRGNAPFVLCWLAAHRAHEECLKMLRKSMARSRWHCLRGKA